MTEDTKIICLTWLMAESTAILASNYPDMSLGVSVQLDGREEGKCHLRLVTKASAHIRYKLESIELISN